LNGGLSALFLVFVHCVTPLLAGELTAHAN
jgi:hypothetical protein